MQNLPSSGCGTLLDWAVNPVKAGWERDQSHGVVVLSGIHGEAIVEALRLCFVEEVGEGGCGLCKPELIVAAYREIEAHRSRLFAEGAAGGVVHQGIVGKKSRAGGDDALKQAGTLLECVEGELTTQRVTEQSAVGGIGAIGAINKRNEFVFKEIEKCGRTTTAAAQGLGDRGRGEVLSAKSHCVAGRRLADVDNDDWGHAFGIDVVFLEGYHQWEMPAIEDVEHGVRLF